MVSTTPTRRSWPAGDQINQRDEIEGEDEADAPSPDTLAINLANHCRGRYRVPRTPCAHEGRHIILERHRSGQPDREAPSRCTRLHLRDERTGVPRRRTHTHADSACGEGKATAQNPVVFFEMVVLRLERAIRVDETVLSASLERVVIDGRPIGSPPAGADREMGVSDALAQGNANVPSETDQHSISASGPCERGHAGEEARETRYRLRPTRRQDTIAGEGTLTPPYRPHADKLVDTVTPHPRATVRLGHPGRGQIAITCPRTRTRDATANRPLCT
ncbi:hypothetical protein FBY40_0190 [Microbacterium sp. SLBN-154]|nr:hypothetical protein FBY40_0190 [Microbacterium sp. SLBN-154]